MIVVVRVTMMIVIMGMFPELHFVAA